MRRLAIFGTGGFGREVLPLVRREYGNADICFVDDDATRQGTMVGGVRVVSLDEAKSAGCAIALAVADPASRRALAQRCEDGGLSFFDVRAPGFRSYDAVETGSGLIACDGAIFTSDIKIGRHFHANIFSYVAHDCVIGDFVTFAPRVNCNGSVHIGDGAYIGTGAILKQGTPDRPLMIGAGAVLGMGAVVTRDVAAGEVVIGNPARPLVRGA